MVSNIYQFALVDWGTSNLRAWLVDIGGGVRAHIASSTGADKLSAHQFEEALKSALSEMGVKIKSITTGFPVVMCGMVGSKTGWQEAQYLPVPVACKNIPDHAVRVLVEGLDVYILPGLCVADQQAAGVMRGEETQLLGFYINNPDFDGIFCLPGTHSKWGTFRNGVVQPFQTAMTGEIFSLLSQQSVIRHVIGKNGVFNAEHPAFRQGVEDSYKNPQQLAFELFTVRARGLLFETSGEEASARLSGMLIGAELAAACSIYRDDIEISLIVSGKLSSLYEAACGYLGRSYKLFDANELVLSGLTYAAERIFLNG